MATAEEMREVRALIGQLRGKDKAARLAATRQMTRISIVLGPERCRNELIPYVVEGVTEVEEVVQGAVEGAQGDDAAVAGVGSAGGAFDVRGDDPGEPGVEVGWGVEEGCGGGGMG